jgi:hypothetical protein
LQGKVAFALLALGLGLLARHLIVTQKERVKFTEQLTSLMRSADVRAVTNIRSSFEDAAKDTSAWYFRGATGSFLRAWTLPTLHRVGINKGSAYPCMLRVEIIDPDNEALCQAYASYRAALDTQREGRSPRQSGWTSDHVRRQCIATLLAVAWYCEHRTFSAVVVMSSSMPVLRFDVSDTHAILTNENKSHPAVVATKTENGQIYSSFRAELADVVDTGRGEAAECTKKSLQKVPLNRDWSRIDSGAIAKLLRHFNKKSIQDDEVPDILDAAFKAPDLYA